MKSKRSPPPPPPPPTVLRRLINIDTAVSLHLHNLTQPILPRSFLKSLEISGDGRLFFPVVLSLLLAPLSTTSPILRTFLLNLLIGAVLDLIVIGLVKHQVRRPRPVYNKHMSLTFAVDHWSFPSGHSSRVCFVASFLYLSSSLIPNLMAQLRTLGFQFADKWIGLLNLDQTEGANQLVLIVCVWAIVTSVSRILLGRHFVFDVVAGALFGVLEGLVVFHYLNCSLLSSILDRVLCEHIADKGLLLPCSQWARFDHIFYVVRWINKMNWLFGRTHIYPIHLDHPSRKVRDVAKSQLLEAWEQQFPIRI